MIAVTDNNSELVSLLLKAGADPNKQNAVSSPYEASVSYCEWSKPTSSSKLAKFSIYNILDKCSAFLASRSIRHCSDAFRNFDLAVHI